MKRFFSLLVLLVVLVGPLVSDNRAQSDEPDEPSDGPVEHKLPQAVAGLRLPSSLHASGFSLSQLRPGGFNAEGRRQVVIYMKSIPVTRLPAGQPEELETHRLAIEEEQGSFLNRALEIDPGIEVLGRVQLVLNAVLAQVDAGALSAISRDPAVLRLSPVINYEPALSETVPYMGALRVHDQGVDGSGIKVAVLDTGVDYTHANLFGPGTLEAYQAAYGMAPSDPRNTTTDDLFPTEKVIAGIDFVGESWPDGPLAPDPDPIDLNGHGTHVANIIGGKKGVAPGSTLYAVKLCPSLTSACSGVALIQAMEFAVDPNGDGNPEDHVDIVNMSLGSGYGQPFDDNLSAAVNNPANVGVLTVAAAGNGSDRPYITSTPGAAATAISVAQTQVPSAFLPTISGIEPEASQGEYQAVFQPWSAPLTEVIEGPAQYGDGGSNLNGCSPFEEASLEGQIVVVDRGDCAFSDKIRHIQEAGGILGIIALVDVGPPFAGGFAEGSPVTIPAYMVGQTDGDILRTGEAVISIAPGQGISLVGSVVDTSSRGPEFQSNHIKPELAAPGASVSAEPGTGTGETPFGGTSGATPMVSGAAALLMQGHFGDLDTAPEIQGLDRVARLTPLEVKASLMNTAEISVRNSADGSLAPITRIGGGEVRVDRALASPVAAWDEDQPSGALSFGFVDVADETISLTRRVRLRNYSPEKLTYQVRSTHQFADDAATGAVTLSTHAEVSVDGNSDTVFEVTLQIDGAKLRDNLMNSGPQGNDPAALTTNEYDGYLILDNGDQSIHLAWHALPRKAARVVVGDQQQNPSGGPFNAIKLTSSIGLTNTGVGTAQNQAYSLLALSPALPEGGRGKQSPTPDIKAIGVRSFEVDGGVCSSSPSYIVAFAVNTWERQTHANWPGIYQFNLDTNQDGTIGYSVFNGDAGLEGGTSEGQNVTWVLDRQTEDMSAVFYTEHATNTANTVLYFCGEQIGSAPPHQEIDVTVEALDIYFGGPGDMVSGITFAPLGERYQASTLSDLPTGGSEAMAVVGLDSVADSSGDIGLLLFTNSDRGPSHRGGATPATEALVFVPPALEPATPTSETAQDTRGNGTMGLGNFTY